jgi:hypothetical protein
MRHAKFEIVSLVDVGREDIRYRLNASLFESLGERRPYAQKHTELKFSFGLKEAAYVLREFADALEAEEGVGGEQEGAGGPAFGSEVKLGDTFTHDRSETPFVCRAITRSDRDGTMKSRTVFEIERETGE